MARAPEDIIRQVVDRLMGDEQRRELNRQYEEAYRRQQAFDAVRQHETRQRESLAMRHHASFADWADVYGSSSVSCATVRVPRMTSECFTTGSVVGDGWVEYQAHSKWRIDGKEQQKAEKKALVLFQNLYGVEACDAYRAGRLVLVRGKRFAWLVGNLCGGYYEDTPFYGKPDVARVDNAKKRHVTMFCVETRDTRALPYTDKVIAIIGAIEDDEGKFAKTINRIEETTLADLPKHGVVC